MNPRVSVILPAYNSEAWVEEAVRSVLDQEFEALELIAINDGSTDRTGEVLHAIVDPRLRVIDQVNRGLAATRDVGRASARAPILSFIDADDRWRRSKLRREMEIFDSEPDVGIVFTDFVRFHEGGFLPASQFNFYEGIRSLPVRPTKRGGGLRIEGPAFELVIQMGEFPAYHSALSYRAAVAGDLPYPQQIFDERGVITFLEDLAFIPRLFARTEVAFIDEPLMEMRRHGANATKHYMSLDVAKRNSLLAIKEEPLSPTQRAALRRRMGKAFALSSRQYAREGRWSMAIGDLWRTATCGRVRAALFGLIRLPLEAYKARASTVAHSGKVTALEAGTR